MNSAGTNPYDQTASQIEGSSLLPFESDLSVGTKGKMGARHFAGLCLGGAKTDKNCLSFIEYYPSHNKIFLSRLFSRISSNEGHSSDQQLVELINSRGKLESLAMDVPLKLPKCLRCRLRCPGYEACKEPEIVWMWKFYEEKKKKKRPVKLFTPYTERCAELYISNHLEEEFHPSPAMGSNLAPLLARSLFLQRRLQVKILEVYPKLSLWRIGRALGIAKSHLRFHKHSLGGEESREIILEKLIEKNIAFIYEQDAKVMIRFAPAFDAFICSLTAVLNDKKQTEPRPRGFPKSESWIEFPKLAIQW